jgi:hypothetical protein
MVFESHYNYLEKIDISYLIILHISKTIRRFILESDENAKIIVCCILCYGVV